MTAQMSLDQEVVIFKRANNKGEKQWFVRVTCNFLEPRVYGPFPAQSEAQRFREGAEFELRKLLDFQLPTLSGEPRLSSACKI